MAKSKDPIETAHDVFERFLSIADPESVQPKPEPEGKDPKRQAAGRRGGKKGGKVRAKTLTPEQRSEIARIAASARWKKSGS